MQLNCIYETTKQRAFSAFHQFTDSASLSISSAAAAAAPIQLHCFCTSGGLDLRLENVAAAASREDIRSPNDRFKRDQIIASIGRPFNLSVITWSCHGSGSLISKYLHRLGHQPSQSTRTYSLPLLLQQRSNSHPNAGFFHSMRTSR